MFVANTLLVPSHPLQSCAAKLLFSPSHQCLLPENLVLVCECLGSNWENSVKTFNAKLTQKVKFIF